MKSIAFGVLVVTGLLTGCGGGNTATTPETKPAAEAIMGGYSPSNTTDPQIRQAATFAATQLGKGSLKTILSAEKQVVAGLNYRMRLALSNGETYEVVVYQDLKDVMKLTEQKLVK